MGRGQLWRLGILVTALVSTGSMESAGQVKATDAHFTQLAWLAGCWAGDLGGRIAEEQWMPARGGTMVGMARAVRGERTVSTELTILRLRGDSLVYEAFPVGQTPTVFVAESVSDSSVVFANPAHDFPQRIIYRLRGDSLLARIEGERNGQLRGVDYPMVRAACEEGRSVGR